MGIKIVYEPAYVATGWFQGSAGITPQSWCDRDLTSDIGGGGGVIVLEILEPPFVNDPDDIFQPPPITVELTAAFFDDADLIFTPIAVRALGPPDQMLKNEVRRIR